jgi:hypothetical protein
MNLSPVVPRIPKWRLEIFNTKYSSVDAFDNDVHQDFDRTRCGWLILDKSNITMFNISHKANIKSNPTGEIEIDATDIWMLGLELIKKPMAGILYGTYTTIHNQPSTETRIAVCVDCTGIANCDPIGYADITGTVGGVSSTTKRVYITGHGTYSTTDLFTAVSAVELSLSDGNATVSVWGKSGSSVGIRECRLLCDTNNDEIYGLVHGGYIKEKSREIQRGIEIVTFELFGYASFAQNNEYIAGNRARYRCSNFSKSSELGACTVASASFRAGGTSCYIGDWDTHHPSGIAVTSAAHKCAQYAAGSESLPYDGWTYDENYSPNTETDYEYYPNTYFRALMAACNMLNSLEIGKPQSRPWRLPCKEHMTLVGDIAADATAIIVAGVPSTHSITVLSYLIIGDEVLTVSGAVSTSGQNTSIPVYRGACKSGAAAHLSGSLVMLPCIGYSADGNTSPVLVRTNQLQEANIKSTVYATLESFAENANSEIATRQYVAWIDPFKQLQFTELDIATSGYGSNLIITADDIIQNPIFELGDVVNQVCGKVTLTDDHWVYCEVSAANSGLTDYDKSLALFGKHTEEIENSQINAVGPTAGKVDFETYAKNYLKIRAFPVLTQIIVVDSLVPDEHFWSTVNTSDDTKKPYLVYTDPPNRYICLLGTKVVCPDFWKPKSSGAWQTSTFVIEEVRISSSCSGTKEFLTTLTISRLTTPAEWI